MSRSAKAESDKVIYRQCEIPVLRSENLRNNFLYLNLLLKLFIIFNVKPDKNMKMEKRPKLRIELTITDKAAELIAALMLIILWAIPLFAYSALPSIIPTHFNFAGEADGYGSRLTIFVLPVIGTFIFALLTILNNYPHIFNFPVQITPKNAMEQYAIATRFIRYFKAVIMGIFAIIVTLTVKGTEGKGHGFWLWTILLMFALIFIPLIRMIKKMRNSK